MLLAVLIWLLLVTAGARPQWIGESIQVSLTGRSLMLAVDLSGSMQKADMVIQRQRVSRLVAVKTVAHNFIQHRKGDHIGLILFGRKAYLQVPLTYDRTTVNQLLDEAQVGLAGKETAIGDAIGLAVKRLRKQPESNRLLILLTDGANTAGSVSPLKAADLAAQEKIRIYTIGVGAAVQVVQGFFGSQQVVNSDLDEPTLQAIARKTSGRYFRARDIPSLQQIYALLDKIEPISKADEKFRPVHELYPWPLAMALLISLLLAVAKTGLIANLPPIKAGRSEPAQE